jgi:hypothetical protein
MTTTWEMLATCATFESNVLSDAAERPKWTTNGEINSRLPSKTFVLTAIRAVPAGGSASFGAGAGVLELHIGDELYFRAPLVALDIWLELAPATLRIERGTELAYFYTDAPALVMVRGLQYREIGNIVTDAGGLDHARELARFARESAISANHERSRR